MASTTSAAFDVLPVVGYALLAVVLAYIALRVYRYLKGAVPSSASVSLPKPVSEAAHHKGFSFGRTTGWGWRRWSSLVPRVPSWPKTVPAMGKGKAKAAASAKNLSVELLPTTGLPPPPTSVPATPPRSNTPQLVDLSSPPTPPLTAGATSTTASYPTSPSPRTPSPSPFHMHHTVKPLFPSAALALARARPSYSRPPSPHALLATTPPPSKPHRRSRSLGGVPVRRLSSGGQSGLRNAVELRELSSTPSHVQGTSREHLLIDFASSGSSDEEDERDRYRQEEEDHIMKISPAASDIGVLPAATSRDMPPIVDVRMVGRHVPLVDLSNDLMDRKVNEDSESWKWFSSAPVPSLSFGRSVRPLVGSTPANSKQMPNFRHPQAEKLIDMDDDVPLALTHPELVSGRPRPQPVPVEIQRTEILPQVVDLTDPKVPSHVEQTPKEPQPLVDLDLNSDIQGTQLVDIEDRPLPSLALPGIGAVVPVFVKPSSSAFSHPLEDLVSVPVVYKPAISTPAPPPEPIVVVAQEESRPGLLFAGSEAQPEPEHQHQHQAEFQPQCEPERELATPASDSTDPDVFSYSIATSDDSDTSVSATTTSNIAIASTTTTEPPSPLLIPSSHTSANAVTATGTGWGWDDLEDPWGNHVPEPEPEVQFEQLESVPSDLESPSSEEFVYSGKGAAGSEIVEEREEEAKADDLIAFEAARVADAAINVDIEEVQTTEVDAGSPLLPMEEEVLDKSPSGSLFATVLPDDGDIDGEEGEDVMPPLDLDGSLAEHEQEEEEEEQEATPKPTPASIKLELPVLSIDIPVVQVPTIVVQDTLDLGTSEHGHELEAQIVSAAAAAAETFPDPDLLPLPDSPSPSLSPLSVAVGIVDECELESEEKTAPSQMPTPPASPPPVSPLRFAGSSLNMGMGKSRPPSPAALSAKLRLPPSPRLTVIVPPPVALTHGEDKENENENDTPTALSSVSSKSMWEAKDGEAPLLRRRMLVKEKEGIDDDKEEVKEPSQEQEQHVHAYQLKLSSSLPGSFPDPPSAPELELAPAPSLNKSTSTSSTSSFSSTNSNSSTTIAARLALAPAVLTPRPSARALARSPLDIALAMQLRPGLGAGADPAWMVRFLMAMFGWLAVVVSGGEQF